MRRRRWVGGFEVVRSIDTLSALPDRRSRSYLLSGAHRRKGKVSRDGTVTILAGDQSPRPDISARQHENMNVRKYDVFDRCTFEFEFEWFKVQFFGALLSQRSSRSCCCACALISHLSLQMNPCTSPASSLVAGGSPCAHSDVV